MDSQNAVYCVRKSHGIRPISKHHIDVSRYIEKGWSEPGALLYSIDMKLPNLAEERPQGLAQVLAGLEDMFRMEKEWENKAKDYLKSYKCTEWMNQQFVRANELGSGGVRRSGSRDREQQTVHPDCKSIIQRSGGVMTNPSQESSRISQVLETNFFGEILSSRPVATAVFAGTLLTAGFAWQYYTDSESGMSML